jgi:hypothetical protein
VDNSRYSTRDELEREERLWTEVSRSNTIDAYERFLADPQNRGRQGAATRRLARLLRKAVIATPEDLALRRRYLAVRDESLQRRDAGAIGIVASCTLGGILGGCLGWLLGIGLVVILFFILGGAVLIYVAVGVLNRTTGDAAPVSDMTRKTTGLYWGTRIAALALVCIGVILNQARVALQDIFGPAGAGALLFGVTGLLLGLLGSEISIHRSSVTRWRSLLGPFPDEWIDQPERMQRLCKELGIAWGAGSGEVKP